MIKDGKGGANTNLSGLKFEKKTDAKVLFSNLKGYSVSDNDLFFEGKKVAEIYKKRELYKKFLEPNNIDGRKILSKLLEPDEAIYLPDLNRIYIIEKKSQSGSGSVDEKLQTCQFKMMQYKKLFKTLEIRIEIIYILNDWFKQPCYKDVLDFIESSGGSYFFEIVPFKSIGLPSPKS